MIYLGSGVGAWIYRFYSVQGSITKGINGWLAGGLVSESVVERLAEKVEMGSGGGGGGSGNGGY